MDEHSQEHIALRTSQKNKEQQLHNGEEYSTETETRIRYVQDLIVHLTHYIKNPFFRYPLLYITGLGNSAHSFYVSK